MKRDKKFIGDFHVFRVKEKKSGKNFVDIYLKGDDRWGWGWGDDKTGTYPVIGVRLFGLNILWVDDVLIDILGFWWLR